MDRTTPPPARPFTFHHHHTVSYDEYYTITGHATGAATQPRQAIVNLEAADIHQALDIAARRYITVFRPFAACFSGVGITVLETRALNDDEGLLLIEEETDRTRHVHHVPVSGSHPEEWLESANAIRYALTTNPCLQAIYDTALAAEPTHPHLRISKTSGLPISSAAYDGHIPLTLPHAARWLHELNLDRPDCAQAALAEGLEIDLSDDPDPFDDAAQEPPRYTTPYTYAALATLPAGEGQVLKGV